MSRQDEKKLKNALKIMATIPSYCSCPDYVKTGKDCPSCTAHNAMQEIVNSGYSLER